MGALFSRFRRSNNQSSNQPNNQSEMSFDAYQTALAQDTELAKKHALRTGYVYPLVNLDTPSSIRIKQSLTTSQRAELVDRIRGILFGQAIGDAVGLPTEFHSRTNCESIWPDGHITLTRAVRSWGVGDWTDDTDQMILILDMLNNNGGCVDVKDFATRLQCWINNGFTELGDCGGYGCGQTVGSVVSHDTFITDPHFSAYQVCQNMKQKAASNGAVMRTSILGIVEFESIQRVIENTIGLCMTTHADPRCIASTIICTVSIALSLQNCLIDHSKRLSTQQIIDMAYQRAINTPFPTPSENDTCTLSCLTPEWAEELLTHCTSQSIDDLQLDDFKRIGYTYKCIGSGVWAFKQEEPDFRHVVTAIAMSGGDADTNGAVAGAMLGARLGYANLDSEWKISLLHPKWLDQKIDHLLELMGLSAPTRDQM